MKRTLTAVLVAVVAAGTAFADASIKISAPQVSAWSQFIPGFGTLVASDAEVAALNSQLTNQFKTLENTLNTQYFNHLSGLNDLSRGFANANAAAFDNASLLGYQTYDLFAVMLGFDLGLAVPTLDPSAATAAITDVINKGDVYAGAATGGFAGQAGLNLGLFIPNLYVTAKAGFVPSLPLNGISFQQSMFGVGANYTLLPQVDILFGFVKWRGLSVGTGLTFNSNATAVDIKIADQSKDLTGITIGGQAVSATATASDIHAKLAVSNSSVVIPIDLMTSLQALWFLNFGLGVGADLSFSSANIKVSGNSDVNIGGINGLTLTPGNVVLTATDSTGKGDFFLPRIAASVGLDLAVLKIDMPVSYFPLSKTFAWGLSGGIVW